MLEAYTHPSPIRAQGLHTPEACADLSPAAWLPGDHGGNTMVLPQPHHPFFLFLVLPLVTALSPGQPVALCPASCHCHRWLLDCSRASMDAVPRATRRWALSVLNFTSNSISSIEKEAWREYPWAEHLILQDNDLRAVKRHSLEGLLLLKHLDLSGNKIQSIEGRAFEPLPFLQLLNLSGNLMARIQKDTFQAWHGVQFLQKVILSHNPLSVIDDASFFQLPAVSYLDLGATRVSRLTVFNLLLTAARLEMLVPRAAACCLCQEGRAAETLCRRVRFQGRELCASSPHCAQAESPAELRAELRRAAQCSAALRPNPTNSSLGDRETVTLRVVLSPPGADGDLGDSGNRISRRSSRSPQQPRRQQLRSALRMGREGGHGGRKLRLPATELKDGQQSIASRLPRPAARSVPKAKAGAHLAGEPSGAEDEDAAIEGDLFESEAEHCLRPVVPNGALRGFVARVARAVRKDCRLPHLQPNCAKLLAHTGRLLGLLGGQRPAAQCAPVGNSSVGTEGRRSGGERAAAHRSSRRVVLAVSVCLLITAYLTAICLIEVCCPKPAAASQPHSTSKSRWRRSFRELLPPRWRGNSGAQALRFAERVKDQPQWLRDLYLPLDELQRNSIYQLYREPEEEEEEEGKKEEEEEVFTTTPEEQHSPTASAP
ncbi:leucine-rich repeat-containing protein 37B isoform X2 [Gallus gallus]|uniref:leucine-rich repeat-containing protein 37B isoform X2 n=1 Tax=Gallus gallus TaxID=9031 RepID=UPI001AEB6038|nr:leucine-rich repeat-containing protein 37B isoform X2 [Gallus gallus]